MSLLLLLRPLGEGEPVAVDPTPKTFTFRDTGHTVTVRDAGHTLTYRETS